ncbi:Bacterial mobilisation domain-containing protein, partial [Dysosmobacter welbionis]
QEGAGVADEGLDLLAKLRHPCLQVIHGVGLGAVDPLQRQVLPLQNARQMVPELFRVQQLAGHDGLLLVLVRIERGDALLGGAVLLVRQAGLLQGVQVPVPGQQQGRPVAD